MSAMYLGRNPGEPPSGRGAGRAALVCVAGAVSVFVAAALASAARAAGLGFLLWPWDSSLIVGLMSVGTALLIPGYPFAFPVGAFLVFAVSGVLSGSAACMAINVAVGFAAFLAGLAGEGVAVVIRTIWRHTRGPAVR